MSCSMSDNGTISSEYVGLQPHINKTRRNLIGEFDMLIDFKKREKEVYLPATEPSIIEVPKMIFIQVDGAGNPNDEGGEYQSALELLYALSYTIKMMPKSGEAPHGYFEYVLPPLEGLWWLEKGDDIDFRDKSRYHWTSMIRQPEFVVQDVFERAVAVTAKKKPHLETSLARLSTITEGLCVQCLHIGPYDAEPASIEKMMTFIAERQLICDLFDTRRHHEIYLSDPRKNAPELMKTVLRYPVKNA